MRRLDAGRLSAPKLLSAAQWPSRAFLTADVSVPRVVRLRLSDARTARLVGSSVVHTDTGGRIVLTEPTDSETISLPTPIKNTKLSPKGRPMAWVVRHKLTWKHALIGGVTTTDELDAYEEAQGS